MRAPLYSLLMTAGCLLAQPPDPPPGPGQNFEKRRETGKEEDDEEKRHEEVKERKRWMRERVWPYGGEIPVDRYVKAKARIEAMQKEKAGRRAAGAGAPWEELGPGNIGGRTRSLLIDPSQPDTMYAAGVSGGVFKTTDGGKNWKPLTDMMSNLMISTMAMDPRDPNTIYAGTGEYWSGVGRGAGLFKTTNGGESWTYLSGTSGTAFYYIHKVIVSANDSNRIYAATWSGIMRSLDGGETWTRALNRAAPNFGCTDVAALKSSEGADTLLAACMGPFDEPIVTLFRQAAAESAEPWEAVLTIPDAWRSTLAVAPSNPDIVYVMSAWGNGSATPKDRDDAFQAIYRSEAGGLKDSWSKRAHWEDGNAINTTLLSNPREFFRDVCLANGVKAWFNQGDWDQVIAVDPVNPDRVWVGGIDLFRSDDGGMKFGIASYWWGPALPQYAHADQHAIVFHPKYDGTENRTMFVANDGGIAKTDNALAAVSSAANAACQAGVAASQMRFTELNSNYGVTQFYSGAVFPSGHYYVGGTQDNGSLVGQSSRGANGWYETLGGDGGYALVHPKDSNVFYVSTQRDEGTWFRRTVNNGYAYRPVMTGITGPFNSTNFAFITPAAMDPIEPNRLYLGGKTLWRSDNRGDQWRAAAAPFPEGVTSSLAIHPTDSNLVLAGTNRGWIHRSSAALGSNSETPWERVRPRTGTVTSLAFDPRDRAVAYAAYGTFDNGDNAGHIFRTADSGANWVRIDAGLPDIPFQSIAVHPSDSNLLYAGSDLGLFVSADGGATWTVETEGLPAVRVESLVWSEDNGPVLFAFTHGRGVFRRRLTANEPCKHAVTGPTSVVAFGGAVNLQVATGANCDWSWFSNTGPFLTAAQSVGKGNGRLSLSAVINDSTVARTASFDIGSQTYRVTQARPEFPVNMTAPFNATRIASLPYVSVQDTRQAAANPDNPTHGCTQARDSKSVWFQFTAATTTPLNIMARGQRYDNGASYGPVLAIYERNGIGDPGQEVACVAQAAGGLSTFVSTRFTPTEAGKQYLIRVSGRGEASPGGYTVLGIGN